jgi:uncharacterized protein YecE (DUF72 family)
MNVWVGTSGYNYPEWKGSFYPETMPAAKMLPYYAERFPTVEINYTFYRAPNEKILSGWSAATPERFKLTLKAPKRITHDRRLKDCADPVRQFLETAAVLGSKLGALLFQLPPNLKKDLALFDAFLDTFPRRSARRSNSATRRGSTTTCSGAARTRARAHACRQREAVGADRDHRAVWPTPVWRDEGYTPGEIEKWAGRGAWGSRGRCEDVFVYF